MPAFCAGRREEMNYYFAADAGGTSVKWAVMDEAYHIFSKGQFPTPYDGAEQLAEQIGREAELQARELGLESFRGIGLSVPGTVYGDREGTVKGGGMLRYLDGVPFGKMVGERCKAPAYVENDGKCCALGEYTAGALKGCRTGVVMALGTGVGGGIVIDGKVYKGSHCFAGEFSFIQLGPMAAGDMTKRFGAAGGWKSGLLKNVLREKGLPPDTDMNGTEIFALVGQGDQDALRGLERYAEDIAWQIWNLQAVLDPEVIAVGGGISSQPVLIEKIQEAVGKMAQENVLKQFPVPQVVRCAYGNEANLVGAVCSCRQRMEQEERRTQHGYAEI